MRALLFTVRHSCREDQDLRAGAIMTAVVEEGEGKNSPGPGDLVGGEQRGHL